jgi:hypothetical protein
MGCGQAHVARLLASVCIVAATLGLRPGSALGAQGGTSAAQCMERYHVYFTPPLELPTPHSGTWGTPDGEPGQVQCSGTFNGEDITGSGTSRIRGAYGTLLTGALGGDTCLLAQQKIVTISFDITGATGRHVHFQLSGTLMRLFPAGVVFGHDNATGVPVTAVVMSQTDQSCASGPVSSAHATLFRALGVGVPPGIIRGDATTPPVMPLPGTPWG